MGVEGYRIPGHRLGMIVAAPELHKHVTTIADCMQVSLWIIPPAFD
jgi:hypothetical protein